MMQMIATYDLQSAIDAAVQEEMLKHQNVAVQNNASIEETLQELARLLKDQQQIKRLWPSAPTDIDLFSHLRMDIDLHDGLVTTETAAKDIHGLPYYQYIFDLKTPAIVGVASIAPVDEDKAINDFFAARRVADEQYWAAYYAAQSPTAQPAYLNPAQPAYLNPASPQKSPLDAQLDAIFGVSLADSEIDSEGMTILTIEEQREVALKVVFGIFAILAAGLIIAYIHD